jgi:hypothetical protein
MEGIKMSEAQKSKLYRQWVEKGDLLPEQADVPLKKSESGFQAGDYCEGDRAEYGPGAAHIRLPTKYILIGAVIIVALLIVLSVLITVLIMR